MSVMKRMLATVLLTLVALIPSYSLANALSEAAQAIKSQQPLSASLLEQLAADVDGQLLLARLYEFGSYGVPVNGQRAFQLYQQAAESGQMQAALYCWDRCLVKTPAVGKALEMAASQGDADGLYLWAKWLAEHGQLGRADQQLVLAAKAGQSQAINELYVQHFLDWSANRTDVDEAEKKLLRCAKEGLVSCQLLLGAFYYRHNDASQALFHYLMLVQLDYPLSRTYLYADEMEALRARMPTDSLVIMQSRVATALVRHPQQRFDAYLRFQACAEQVTYACIRQVVKRDQACMVSGFADSYLQGLRASAAYQRCLEAQ